MLREFLKKFCGLIPTKLTYLTLWTIVKEIDNLVFKQNNHIKWLINIRWSYIETFLSLLQVLVSCISLSSVIQAGINLAFSGILLPQLAADPNIEHFTKDEASWIGNIRYFVRFKCDEGQGYWLSYNLTIYELFDSSLFNLRADIR